MRVVHAAAAAALLLAVAAVAQTGKAGARIEKWAEGLKGPQGLALSPQGEVLVAENGSGRILRFATDGRLLGTAAEGLKGPSWLLDTPHGLLAAERQGNSVALLPRSGEVRRLKDEVIDPLGMRLDPASKDHLLVLSHRTSRILRVPLDSSGGPATAVFAAAEGAKYGARDFLLRPDRSLLITDEISNAIIRYRPGGTPELWVKGLSSPSGLFLSPGGDLYLTEEGTGRVSRVAADGSVHPVAEGLGAARTGLFLDARTLLVSDRRGGVVWKITLAR